MEKVKGRRELTEVEKHFIEKNVKSAQKKIKMLDFKIKQCVDWIGEGCYLEYQNMLEGYYKQKRNYEQEKAELLFTINAAKNQIDKGVKVKE